VVAVRAVPNIGRESIGGQTGRNKDMVQSGAMVVGGVGKGEIMMLSSRESGIKIFT
jgi:hypothetical protein